MRWLIGATAYYAAVEVVQLVYVSRRVYWFYYLLETMRLQPSVVHIPTILVADIAGKQVCLETLTELAVADPRVVAHANGFRVLFAATIDPANQVSLERSQ